MKKFIFLVLGLLVVIGLIVASIYVNIVTITLDEDVATVEIRQGDTVTRTVSDREQRVLLLDGDYQLVPSGEKIDTTPITVSVMDSQAVAVNPGYSNEYLSSQIKVEQPAVWSVIQDKYPEASGSYEIQNATLFGKGEWFGGVLAHTSSSYNSTKDFYRFIAKKDGSTWSIINSPELVLTKNVFTEVPQNILDTINTLEQTTFAEE